MRGFTNFLKRNTYSSSSTLGSSIAVDEGDELGSLVGGHGDAGLGPDGLVLEGDEGSHVSGGVVDELVSVGGPRHVERVAVEKKYELKTEAG